MKMPHAGSTVAIKSVKHDGMLHRCWKENTILYQDEDKVVGYNDATLVQEPGKVSRRTDVPSIFYFYRRYWFNVIYLLTEQPMFYCNMSSPFTYTDGIIQYVDYDLDILVQSNRDVQIVDQQEYDMNCEYYSYPQHIQNEVIRGVHQLVNWIIKQQGPFERKMMAYYYKLYMESQSK